MQHEKWTGDEERVWNQKQAGDDSEANASPRWHCEIGGMAGVYFERAPESSATEPSGAHWLEWARKVERAVVAELEHDHVSRRSRSPRWSRCKAPCSGQSGRAATWPKTKHRKKQQPQPGSAVLGSSDVGNTQQKWHNWFPAIKYPSIDVNGQGRTENVELRTDGGSSDKRRRRQGRRKRSKPE
ncbi:hypothetical protein CI238_10060 [Colletotrichum incanum]|uniref:Uncharacterized protein n=1 Tax=Colletotrichum incanum TaxID=1573173 RepID=A0A161WHM6_COLIC|nr:hypothetical protein CI238_10060 [Colletotrichum incanum]